MKPKILGVIVTSLLSMPAAHAWANDIRNAVPDSQAAAGSVGAGTQADEADQADKAAKQKAKSAAAPEVKQLQALQVTGSLIPRAQVEGPSPVITVTAEDIEQQGFGNVFDALRALPVSNGSVQDPQSTGGYTPGAKTISLFGLNPSFTLTLLNGKPMTSYPLAYNGSNNIVDIANIPIGMIERIDVLTGGQSSIYGSAAIAGVVNIVLKDHVEGTHMSLRMGGYNDGGGDNQRLQLSTGHRWGKLDVSAGLQVSRETPVWAFQRSYIDSYDDDPTGKPGVPSRTFLRMATGSDPHYIDPGAAACAPLGYLYSNSTRYSHRDGASLGNYCGSPSNVGLASLSNKSTDVNGSLFLRYHVNGNTELYSDMLYSYSNPTYSGGSPFWNQTFYNQTSGQYEQWQRIFAPEEVGLDAKDQHVFTHTYNASFGIRGGIGDTDWSYDAYYNRSQSNVVRKSTDFLADNGVDAYYLGPQLGTDASGYPIFAPRLDRLYQPLTTAQYQQFSATNRASSMSWTQNETITANTTDLFQLPAGPVGFAAIVQASNERFDNRSGSPLADEGYFRGVGGSTVASGARSQYAAGAEMQVPLLKTLSANLSARYDKYSYDGGGNGKATYKLGLEYRPMDHLLLRGSYATAFRAPDMFYLFSSRSSGYSNATDYYKCRAAGYTSDNFDNCPQAGGSMLAVSSGNTGLKDITAKSFTYGFVWSNADNNLTWSMDYNAIRISNEVAILGSDEILELEANCRLGVSENGQTTYDINSPTCAEALGEVQRLPASDPVNPGGVQQVSTYPINVSSEYQTGIQSNLTYRLDAGAWGKFVFSGDYYNEFKHTWKEKQGDATYDLLCCANSDEFKSRVSGSLTWNVGDWSSTVYGIRNGSTWNAVGTAKNIAPWVLFNASVRYRVNPVASIALVVNNIANKRPPLDRTNGNWPYYDVGNYNAYGRALWVELGLDFGK